jgi:hypothetical protein
MNTCLYIFLQKKMPAIFLLDIILRAINQLSVIGLKAGHEVCCESASACGREAGADKHPNRVVWVQLFFFSPIVIILMGNNSENLPASEQLLFCSLYSSAFPLISAGRILQLYFREQSKTAQSTLISFFVTTPLEVCTRTIYNPAGRCFV